MRIQRIHKRIVRLLGLAFIAGALIGCAQTTASGNQPVVAADSTSVTYSGQLRTDYDDALGVSDQLALGILRLEESQNAVTEEQAATMLPLWEALQGTAVQTEAEQMAVAKQIEGTLDEAQVKAILDMQLTQAGMQTWLQEQMPGRAGATGEGFQGPDRQQATGADPTAGGTFGGRGGNMSEEERTAMRERFQNMSDEERNQMRGQFAQGGTMPGGGAFGDRSGSAQGASAGILIRAVITLLTERSGQAPAMADLPPRQEATPEDATTATTEPSPTPTATPIAQVTLPPMPTSTLTVTPTPTPTAVQASATSTTKPVSTRSTSTEATTTPKSTTTTVATSSAVLTQVPDTDPGPPLEIEVTTNYAEADPYLESGLIYKVGGVVRNPTDQAYVVTAVHVTFFDADGFRGAFYAFPSRAGQRGIRGEWISHGALEAEIVCNLLGPGESCPFTAEIAGQNMASFLVHPDAEVAEWHEASPVTIEATQVTDTGASYVIVKGTVSNPNVYPIKNIVVSALLLDDEGNTVSMGTGIVQSLEAGASAKFEVYVEKQAYSSYQLYARAEQSN